MAAANFLSGKAASVAIGEAVFRFKSIDLEFETAFVEANNFSSTSQVGVPGLDKGSIGLDGPYDAGNMPFTTGTTYSFIVTPGGAVSWTVPFFVEKIGIKTDVEDMARVTLSGTSNGAITPTIS